MPTIPLTLEVIWMFKFKRFIDRLRRAWERFLLSLQEERRKKYGLAPFIILAVVAVVALLLIIYLLVRFWGLIILLVIWYVLRRLDHPASPVSQEDELGFQIGEVIAVTTQNHHSQFGLVRPAKVYDVFPNGRGIWDDSKGYIEYRYIVYTLKDELDCEAFRDLVQRELNKAFAGASIVIVVEVRPSLLENRGYDIIVMINPPKEPEVSSRSDGFNGCDLIDEELGHE